MPKVFHKTSQGKLILFWPMGVIPILLGFQWRAWRRMKIHKEKRKAVVGREEERVCKKEKDELGGGREAVGKKQKAAPRKTF